DTKVFAEEPFDDPMRVQVGVVPAPVDVGVWLAIATIAKGTTVAPAVKVISWAIMSSITRFLPEDAGLKRQKAPNTVAEATAAAAVGNVTPNLFPRYVFW